MSDDKERNDLHEKKIRFRPASRVLFKTDSKIEDLFKADKCDMTVDDTDNSKRG